MIFILLVLCIVEFQLAASCVYGDGTGCRFPCRCETGECDSVTGTCTTGGCAEVLPNGHEYGWKGVGCRIGNIAYDKNTSQSGAWAGLTSERAVDGNTDPNLNHGSCIHPLTSETNTAWWMVDLGKKHVIEKIVIFNRDSGQFRTNDFDIRIGMTSTIDDQDLCVFYNDGEKTVLTLTCTEDVTEGRYVSMRRRWRPIDTDYNVINICEFVVIGYEPIECSNKCSGSCDDLSGCDTCGEGFKLPDCIDECDSGTWGTNCVSQCGQCSGNTPCDRQTGECRDVCEQWYLEDKCDVHIEIPQLNTSVVKMDVVSSSVIKITWQQDENIPDKLAEHYFYRVQYGPTGEDKISSKAMFQNREHLSLNLTDLTPNTEYEVIIVPYRVQDTTEEAGISTLAVTDKTLCRPSGPSEPFINVTTNRHSWTVYFTPLRKLDSGCDDMASYILNVAHGDIIVHSLSVWNVSSVDLPFKPVYVEAAVWIEAINNVIISTDSKKEILFMGSSTVATIMSTRSDEVESEETQEKTILIISCVIGVFGLTALVVGIILTVKRSKLCIRNNSNTEMTHAYENAKTFDPKCNHRNDMMQISPNYENTQDTKVTQKDNLDNGRNDNIEYEEIPGQQMTNPYETLDVNDHDATPTVYQSFN